MRISHALDEVNWIRDRIASSDSVHCIRYPTVGCIGVMALIASIVQSGILKDPTSEPISFLFYWATIAVLCLLFLAATFAVQQTGIRSSLATWQFKQIAISFSPSVLVGGLISFTIVYFVPQQAVMLPAWWAACFSLGNFALYQRLGNSALIVAAFYLFASVVCLLLVKQDAAFHPLAVGGTFGAGHFLMAICLYLRSRKTIPI